MSRRGRRGCRRNRSSASTGASPGARPAESRARPCARLTPLLGAAYDPPDDERATRRWALGAFACL